MIDFFFEASLHKYTKELVQNVNAVEKSSQSTDLNTINHLWQDLKAAVQSQPPHNITELAQLICSFQMCKIQTDPKTGHRHEESEHYYTSD